MLDIQPVKIQDLAVLKARLAKKSRIFSEKHPVLYCQPELLKGKVFV
jgi:hypothetical protein